MPVGTTPGSHSHYCRIHRLSVSRLSLGEHRTPCRTAPARPHRRPRRTGHSETLGHSAICARDRLAFSLAFLSRHAEHSSTMYIDARARDARADSANLHKSTGHKESTRWSADRRARGGTATIVASGRRRGAWLPVEPRRIRLYIGRASCSGEERLDERCVLGLLLTERGEARGVRHREARGWRRWE